MAKRYRRHQVKELMTSDPVCLPATASLREASRIMRDKDIGDVLIVDASARVCGILTDRDIVLRALAANLDPDATTCAQICSRNLLQVRPEDDVDVALKLMREAKIRRLPVTEAGVPRGIVSLGDLAEKLDPHSVLAEVSAATPQH
jgi:CBS domain-containing protein